MRLDYKFIYDGKEYIGTGVDIGDTCDLASEKEDIKGLKESAICHEFDLSFPYDEEKIAEIMKDAQFEWCELQDED